MWTAIRRVPVPAYRACSPCVLDQRVVVRETPSWNRTASHGASWVREFVYLRGRDTQIFVLLFTLQPDGPGLGHLDRGVHTKI